MVHASFAIDLWGRPYDRSHAFRFHFSPDENCYYDVSEADCPAGTTYDAYAGDCDGACDVTEALCCPGRELSPVDTGVGMCSACSHLLVRYYICSLVSGALAPGGNPTMVLAVFV